MCAALLVTLASGRRPREPAGDGSAETDELEEARSQQVDQLAQVG
jgi:hypothetical protein